MWIFRVNEVKPGRNNFLYEYVTKEGRKDKFPRCKIFSILTVNELRYIMTVAVTTAPAVMVVLSSSSKTAKIGKNNM